MSIKRNFYYLLLSGAFIVPHICHAQDKVIIAEPEIQILAKTQGAAILDHLDHQNDTLYLALRQAHVNNPSLKSVEAQTDAVKTQLSQAQAGYLPSISANADVTQTNTTNEGTSFGISEGGNLSKGVSLNLDQNIYKGGSTIANIRSAKNTILEQEMRLSAEEQKVLYDATSAYMELLRNKALVELNENNRDLVAMQLEQTSDRFRVGELTRTDVSQAEARLANAEANVITASGALRTAQAVYREVIGTAPPEDMAYPVNRLVLPSTIEEALDLAAVNNRSILMAKYKTAASEDNVKSVYGELYPQVSLGASASKSYDSQDMLDEQDQTRIGLTASIPLYQSGSVRARAKEAKAIARQRQSEVVEAQNQALQEVESNWESLKSAEAEIIARQAQVDAAAIAREGTHYEAELGERTTLDALDANQEYLDAQVNLITAKKNEIVAQFALARSLGVLTPAALDINTAQ